MEIIPVEAGPVATLGYLVIDMNQKVCVIIDTPLDSSEVFLSIAEENGLKISAIILTHSHWDHFADASLLKEKTNAPVYVHKADEYRLINPMANTIMPLPFSIRAVTPDVYLNDNDILSFSDELVFDVIFTPGHTEGGVCFINHLNQSIYSGDTIFNSSIGRCDLPGGNFELLINSIKSKIFTLPDNYKIYPGHGEPTTVGEEKVNNPFLQ